MLISDSEVRLRSTATRLRGSPFVASSGLNERFDMAWATRLTWGATAGGAASSFICVETELRVWCEVLPPFHLMPRTLLATACNAVLRRALPSLLSVFVVQLGKDYARWAAEPDYRAARAAPKPALLAA